MKSVQKPSLIYASGVSVLLLLVLHMNQSGAQLPLPEFKQVHALPSDIPTCSQTDLNLNECIRSAFQSMMPRVKDGIEELNIPSLDPFILEKASYQYSMGLLQGRVAVKNVRVYGMSGAVFDRVDFEKSDDTMRMEVEWHVPHILVEGSYKADMKLNDIKMTPKGYFNISIIDLSMKAQPEGEFYERDGHKYLRLTKFQTEPNVGDMQIYANGLLPDPALNAVVLDFINQYWRQIYKTLLPETRTTWMPFLLSSANQFFAALPFDLLLTKN